MLDSEKFNEWMNPVDYETEEAIAEQERLGLLIEGPTGGCPGANHAFHAARESISWSSACGCTVIKVLG